MPASNENAVPASSQATTPTTAVAKPERSKRLPSSASGYTLRQQIGRGTSAVVYRALCTPYQDEPSIEVAVKVIDLEWLQAPLDDIWREIQVMSLSSHTNVVPFSTAFVNGADLWIVMPLLTGGSVLELMEELYPNGLPENLAVFVIYSVLKAIDYFHGNNQIHRDVKARNVLLDSKGNVMLSDYGMMGWMVEGGWERKQRQTFIGTPCWMAPEVMEQVDGYDYKADVWSLGITAIEIAQGKVPYSGAAPMKVLLMTLQNPPPTMEEAAAEKFSDKYQDFIRQCLQKDPTERPSAATLLMHPLFAGGVPKPEELEATVAKLPPIGSRGNANKVLVQQLNKNHQVARSGIFELSSKGQGWDFGDGELSVPNSSSDTLFTDEGKTHSAVTTENDVPGRSSPLGLAADVPPPDVTASGATSIPAKTVGMLKRGRFTVSDVGDKVENRLHDFLDDDSSAGHISNSSSYSNILPQEDSPNGMQNGNPHHPSRISAPTLASVPPITVIPPVSNLPSFANHNPSNAPAPAPVTTAAAASASVSIPASNSSAHPTSTATASGIPQSHHPSASQTATAPNPVTTSVLPPTTVHHPASIPPNSQQQQQPPPSQTQAQPHGSTTGSATSTSAAPTNTTTTAEDPAEKIRNSRFKVIEIESATATAPVTATAAAASTATTAVNAPPTSVPSAAKSTAVNTQRTSNVSNSGTSTPNQSNPMLSTKPRSRGRFEVHDIIPPSATKTQQHQVTATVATNAAGTASPRRTVSPRRTQPQYQHQHQHHSQPQQNVQPAALSKHNAPSVLQQAAVGTHQIAAAQASANEQYHLHQPHMQASRASPDSEVRDPRLAYAHSAQNGDARSNTGMDVAAGAGAAVGVPSYASVPQHVSDGRIYGHAQSVTVSTPTGYAAVGGAGGAPFFGMQPPVAGPSPTPANAVSRAGYQALMGMTSLHNDVLSVVQDNERMTQENEMLRNGVQQSQASQLMQRTMVSQLQQQMSYMQQQIIQLQLECQNLKLQNDMLKNAQQNINMRLDHNTFTAAAAAAAAASSSSSPTPIPHTHNNNTHGWNRNHQVHHQMNTMPAPAPVHAPVPVPVATPTPLGVPTQVHHHMGNVVASAPAPAPVHAPIPVAVSTQTQAAVVPPRTTSALPSNRAPIQAQVNNARVAMQQPTAAIPMQPHQTPVSMPQGAQLQPAVVTVPVPQPQHQLQPVSQPQQLPVTTVRPPLQQVQPNGVVLQPQQPTLQQQRAVVLAAPVPTNTTSTPQVRSTRVTPLMRPLPSAAATSSAAPTPVMASVSGLSAPPTPAPNALQRANTANAAVATPTATPSGTAPSGIAHSVSAPNNIIRQHPSQTNYDNSKITNNN